MNIKDVVERPRGKRSPLLEGDKLERIFDRQKELERKYNPIERSNGALVPDTPLDVSSRMDQYRIRDLINRQVEELYEAQSCLKNKAWKRDQVLTDREHFLEELGDAIHFMIALFTELGLSAEDFYDIYFRKSEVNQFRIRSNY